MRFKDKIAIVTAGGAGIGKATVEILAGEGAVVVALDVNEDRLTALEEQLKDAEGYVIGRNADAGNPEAVAAVVDEVLSAHGRIDILVNGVGGSTIIEKPSAAIDELTFEDWQRIVDFNLNATFLMTNAIVPIMKRQKHGKIVNLSSIAGRGLSASSSSAYAAAKGGIIAFTRKLATELGPFGVTINSIAPSLTLTERITPHWEKRSAEDRAATVEGIPLGRVANAMDQAKVIAFLASSDADFITGITIDVSGGLA